MADKVVFAYLDAGAKSSPVALDPGLSTGKPETVWLFNLARGEFVEYRRDIVEAKLRDFKEGEEALCKELKKAFTRARKTFHTRVPQRLSIPPESPGQSANDTADSPEFTQASTQASTQAASLAPSLDEAEVVEDELLDIDPDLETVEDLDENLE